MTFVKIIVYPEHLCPGSHGEIELADALPETDIGVIVVFGKHRLIVGRKVFVPAVRNGILETGGKGCPVAEIMDIAYFRNQRAAPAVDIHDIGILAAVGECIIVVAAIVAGAQRTHHLDFQ